jgi:hypothetical protein
MTEEQKGIYDRFNQKWKNIESTILCASSTLMEGRLQLS